MSAKDAYEKKLRARLDEWNAEVEKLKARAAQLDADAQIEYNRQLDELRLRQQQAEDRLRELRTAGEDAWRDVAEGIEKAWDDLEAAVRDAHARFRE